jgi:hypothetical protein
MAVGRRSGRYRASVVAALALPVGLAIALVDGSPGWDSTGITAGALLVAGGTAAFIARDRPWLWALLVGVPTPTLEILGTGATGSLLALAFAGVGAAIGWGAARTG